MTKQRKSRKPSRRSRAAHGCAAVLNAIVAALNEIGDVLSYQPDISIEHKQDLWRKINVATIAADAFQKRHNAEVSERRAAGPTLKTAATPGASLH